MFDLSWLELGFVAALALIVIGPKDLPKMFKMVSHVINKSKRMMNDVKGGFKQLENEINLSQSDNETDWKTYLPKEIQHLPDDFTPGTLSAEAHAARRQHNNAQQEITNARITQAQASAQASLHQHVNADMDGLANKGQRQEVSK
ncbi:hypothetical protein Glaag_1656 [Glaciecola sp. 4H-3-7+YE-5]|nr:hypothetical protein Glaag_1656 [Glaciecola sp. 4H-3-7+YE-5]